MSGFSAFAETLPRRDDPVDDLQAALELRGETVSFDLVTKQIEEIMALTSELAKFAEAQCGANFMMD